MADTENTDEEKTTPEKGLQFLKKSVLLIVFLVLYFGYSGIILYACKIAQSSVLPDDSKCKPYTKSTPTISPIDINIFTTTIDDEQRSMKLNVPYDKFNSSNMILDSLTDYKRKLDSSFILNFFSSILERVMRINYLLYGVLLNQVNGLSESVLVLIGPILIGIFAIIMYIINLPVFIYVWLSELKWFFLENKNTSGKGEPLWDNINVGDKPFSFFLGVILAIVFFFVLFIGFGGWMLAIFIIMLICAYTVITFKSELNGVKSTSKTIAKETLIQYKHMIFVLFVIGIAYDSFTNFGTGGLLITIILSVFSHRLGLIPFFTNKEENLEGFSKIVTDSIATKTCETMTEVNKLAGGGLFGSQSRGSIKSQLKEIGRNLMGKKGLNKPDHNNNNGKK